MGLCQSDEKDGSWPFQPVPHALTSELEMKNLKIDSKN
jgi:hypothetical protein